MASIFDVAKYILDKKGEMSTWKLQKLCYYSQAWTIAWSDKPLFEEDFEAWSNGPVCPVLFQEHRGMFSISTLKKGDVQNLTEDEKENIDIILHDYGDKDAFWLREQTHNEAPWKDARGNLPEGSSCQNLITKESMGIYYGGL